MRKLEAESWEELMAKEWAALDVADDPSEELWQAEGDGAYDELCCGPEHFTDRWELDPASAEDWFDRTKGVLAQKWRHFGH